MAPGGALETYNTVSRGVCSTDTHVVCMLVDILGVPFNVLNPYIVNDRPFNIKIQVARICAAYKSYVDARLPSDYERGTRKDKKAVGVLALSLKNLAEPSSQPRAATLLRRLVTGGNGLLFFPRFFVVVLSFSLLLTHSLLTSVDAIKGT